MISSNFYGYAFLNVIPTVLDFYQLFNITLFFFYFRFASFFDVKELEIKKFQKIIFISILLFNLISISMLTPWGIKNIMPLFLTQSLTDRFDLFFTSNLYLPRVVGIVGNANSSAILVSIVLICLIIPTYLQDSVITKALIM